jgi:hypothetical protein
VECEPEFSSDQIPTHLPRLSPGGHAEESGKVCAMEAAAWLAGERWSARPRSVHRVVARVARDVNDRASDDERQTLWPLIVASLDTARPRHPILGLRLSWHAERGLKSAAWQGDLRQAWRAVLDKHARLYGPHPPASIARGLGDLSAHQQAARR